MSQTVAVIGSGYAGAGAIEPLQEQLGEETDLVWISAVDHHLVLHETHRCIRNPSVRKHVAIPVEEITDEETRFIQGEVTGVDTDDREIDLEDGSVVEYDYALFTIGSQTAFFGIDGLEEHALTLKTLEDALSIHDEVAEAAREATEDDPAQVIVGGAGLSGIQSAGEIAVFRDTHDAPIEITLVEGLDHVLPNNDPGLQGILRRLLNDHDVEIRTGEFIEEVDEGTVYVGEETELDHDVLLWAGGITGQDAARNSDLDQDDRSHRINASSTFETSDDRVFALGDAGLVEQKDTDDLAPPTAQAAWQAAEVAADNVVRAIHGQPPKEWSLDDKGTLVSVGDAAVAHDVPFVPVRTFSGKAAENLKKAVAARWLNTVTGPLRAARAWSSM